MKNFKKCLALFSVALICLLPLFGSAITAEASTAKVWYVKYVSEINEWRWQPDTWKEDGHHRELYYLQQDIKDGDTIVIDGTGSIDLTVGVNLGNLTILNPDFSMVAAKSIDKFYAGGNCSAAINCDVNEAYVYDQCSVNFNNNVKYVEIICKDGPKANVAVLGTASHVKGWDGTKVSYEAYNFASGKLRINDGALKTDAADYSTTPSAAPAPSVPSAPAAGSSSADDYDEVPKTGDFGMNIIWLSAIAILCLFGSYKLKAK